MNAVRSGRHGRIALSFVAWSSAGRHDLLVPWMLIDGILAARQFATILLHAPGPIPGFTSISGAIDFARQTLSACGYAADRRVIDVSGDGTNNDGRTVTEARDEAVAAGIAINGLPIVRQRTGHRGLLLAQCHWWGCRIRYSRQEHCKLSHCGAGKVRHRNRAGWCADRLWLRNVVDGQFQWCCSARLSLADHACPGPRSPAKYARGLQRHPARSRGPDGDAGIALGNWRNSHLRPFSANVRCQSPCLAMMSIPLLIADQEAMDSLRTGIFCKRPTYPAQRLIGTASVSMRLSDPDEAILSRDQGP